MVVATRQGSLGSERQGCNSAFRLAEKRRRKELDSDQMQDGDLCVVTDERCVAYAAAGHPERPSRVSGVLAGLRAQRALTVRWQEPKPVGEETVLRAHTPGHVHHLLSYTADFDADTPWLPEIGGHAWRAVGGALGAMHAALRGERGFSVMRPPGHHATRGRAMGFCYLNNVAIAALEALALGVERVAVFDFDVHHGNGTEAILLSRAGTATYSVHQYPCYPGTGLEDLAPHARNYPVAPMTARQEYRRVLAGALQDLSRFQPQLVAVSAGFDAYAKDPIAQEELEVEDFYWLGGRIRELEAPSFSVLEGGYSEELPELVLAYLRGWCGQ
jgi:acetoin utilization deacetylase AcuC-like enzyme